MATSEEWTARIGRDPGGTFTLTMGTEEAPGEPRSGLTREEVIRDVMMTADGDHVTVIGPPPHGGQRMRREGLRGLLEARLS